MIVGSVLLILVAIVLLGLGLAGDSDVLLFGSIAASLLAAIALYVGARQAAASQVASERDEPELDVEPVPSRDDEDEETSSTPRQPAFVAPAARAPVRSPDWLTEPVTPSAVAPSSATPSATTGSARSAYAVDVVEDELGDEFDDEDPPDEPAPQVVSAADAARVGRMSVEVLVIDGRPRYHQRGCVHLLGRDSEPLPVSEVVELGFTPCGRCEPDSALLAEARRV